MSKKKELHDLILKVDSFINAVTYASDEEDWYKAEEYADALRMHIAKIRDAKRTIEATEARKGGKS